MAGRGRGMALTRPAWMRTSVGSGNHNLAVTPSLPSSTAPQRPPPTTSDPPTDWARATAVDGRPYWYSLSTGATTWADPTVASPPSKSSSLPAAKADFSPWRETRAEDGRVYYYNAKTKQTQWDRPSDMPPTSATPDNKPNVKDEEEKHPLPDGWAQNVADDGRVYYYHAATRETRWDRPSLASDAQRKRPAADISAASVASSGVDDWREHTAPDGRTYFYNAQTRETSWKKPEALMTEGAQDRKRARVDRQLVPDLRQAIARSRERKAGERGRTEKKGEKVARRPRSREGKTLTDHQAETYFLNRAKIRKEAAAAADGDAEGKQPADLMQLETEEQRENVFFDVLRERGIGERSSWLETMNRCAEDPRYTLLQPYGVRKHAWQKWTQNCAKQARRRSILEARGKSEAFLALMEELFSDEPFATTKLERCDSEKVTMFEGDGRVRAVDERTRSSLIKAFFGIRGRNGERERAMKRKECIAKMRDALDEMVDPAILPPKEGKKTKEDDTMVDVSDTKDKPNGEHGANGTSEKGDRAFFSDRTPFRELDRFLSSIPGSETVGSNDRASVIRDWRRVVERWVHENRTREREARRALQKERRAKFRSGVERMILDGHISSTARWKEVADLVSKEGFAVPEEELDARPSDLFADAQVLFDDRVEDHRENFKRLLRDENIEIQDTTTVEDLQKAESLDKFIKSLDRPVVDALLADRQRKESRKRQKELWGAMADFEKLLQRSEISMDSTFETATEVWKDRTAFKQLHALAGDDGVRKVYDEFMERRRAREERTKEHQNRLKRKFEEQPVPPSFDHEALAALERAKRIRLPTNPAQPVLIPYRAKPVEEESGWAAALSSKPMTPQEKLEAKERRKRELLEGLGSRGS